MFAGSGAADHDIIKENGGPSVVWEAPGPSTITTMIYGIIPLTRDRGGGRVEGGLRKKVRVMESFGEVVGKGEGARKEGEEKGEEDR